MPVQVRKGDREPREIGGRVWMQEAITRRFLVDIPNTPNLVSLLEDGDGELCRLKQHFGTGKASGTCADDAYRLHCARV